MPEIEIDCPNESATQQAGERLADYLTQPITIGFSGTLGSGKTRLIKAIAAGLGVPPDQVSSPTFTICQEYPTDQLRIYHIDLYRIANEDELLELGIEQWTDGDGIALIEWIDRFPWLADSCDLLVDLQISGPDSREITLRPGRSSTLFEQLRLERFL